MFGAGRACGGRRGCALVSVGMIGIILVRIMIIIMVMVMVMIIIILIVIMLLAIPLIGSPCLRVLPALLGIIPLPVNLIVWRWVVVGLISISVRSDVSGGAWFPLRCISGVMCLFLVPGRWGIRLILAVSRELTQQSDAQSDVIPN